MNGDDFLDALKRIGYPGADRLDSRSFDWLFDYDATLPFLKSFCKDVQSSNVLDKKDLDEYCCYLYFRLYLDSGTMIP